MLPLMISHGDGRPLVEQIVTGVRRQIEERHLRPGAQLPSIRRLAEAQEVSRFTVVEAYDRLVAMGYLKSRPGAGFYAAAPDRPGRSKTDCCVERGNEDLVWLIRNLLEAEPGTALAGGPWLPNEWLDDAGIRSNLHVLARKNGAYLIEYGNPFGYLPLRQQLALMLAEIGINAAAGQIVTTHGTSEALNLVVRRLLRPGDAVLVDDPGYYNLFGNLRLSGIRMFGVPRQTDGPDIELLERLVAEHAPKLYFTQSVMQNPTGTDMSPHVAFRVLQIAEQHDFQIVEDDIFCDLQARLTPRLATLDQLARVIYVRSFSKTISGSLRVGFIAAAEPLAGDIADVKMLTSITSSQFAERLLYLMLVDGHYRKFLTRLIERLDETRIVALGALERVGLKLFTEPQSGMFVWARIPGVEDSLRLAQRSLKDGIMLAPGTVFRPHLEPSPWMRFNVTACAEPRVLAWLERAADDSACRPVRIVR